MLPIDNMDAFRIINYIIKRKISMKRRCLIRMIRPYATIVFNDFFNYLGILLKPPCAIHLNTVNKFYLYFKIAFPFFYYLTNRALILLIPHTLIPAPSFNLGSQILDSDRSRSNFYYIFSSLGFLR